MNRVESKNATVIMHLSLIAILGWLMSNYASLAPVTLYVPEEWVSVADFLVTLYQANSAVCYLFFAQTVLAEPFLKLDLMQC